MTNQIIYSAISVMADALRERGATMTLSQLAEKLTTFFDEDFVGGRGTANRVKGAYNYFGGDAAKQENIAAAFVNEQGEYAYE